MSHIANRKAGAKPADEASVHRAIVEHLVARGAGLVWFHPANGGSRNVIEAANLKRMGVRPGVCDLIFVHNSRVFGLELKREGGRPSASQMEFISQFNAAGGCACVAHGIDPALRVLERWGLLRGTQP
jgi:hypothetical protein